MAISPARRAASEILRRVETETAFASVLLAKLDATMRDDDRALCHELVLGVLRRRLWLDRTLEHFTNRPLETLDLPVRLSLELALYQIKFLTRVPPSAAVNEAVNLVRAARLKSAAGFVNAVLRRVTRERDFDPVAELSDPIEKVAVGTSHPRWLIERWANSFGLDRAEQLARANNSPAAMAFRLTLRGREQKNQILATLAAAGARVTQSKLTPESWRVSGAPAMAHRLAREGLIYFQDEASQMVAYLLNVHSGDRVLDMAAAPGSKATHMAMLAPDATIIAGDAYVHRVKTMRELAQSQNARIHVVAHDALRELPFGRQSFDCVLLDAPCSGTGTLRHNPEIRWRLDPGQIDELSSQQQIMLENAARMVRGGGRVVYSTCSVEIQENESVIYSFLSNHRDFSRALQTRFNELRTEAGDIRTWPQRDDVDGFFVAILERRN